MHKAVENQNLFRHLMAEKTCYKSNYLSKTHKISIKLNNPFNSFVQYFSANTFDTAIIL